MKFKHCLLILCVSLFSIGLFSFAIKSNRIQSLFYSTFHPKPILNVHARLKQHGIQLKSFLSTHPTYNDEIAFMVDMKISSNKFRFFVFNLKTDSILKQGIVAHGIGSNTDKPDSLIFKNEVNSKCTSLGKYAVGHSYEGRFGTSYKLYGLDKSNSRAFERFVVLHSYWKVPYSESIFPIINSEGCAMLSPDFLKELEPIIDHSNKQIILYIYS